MIQILLEYWYGVILLIIFGMILAFLIKKQLKKLFNFLKRRATFLRPYWTFIIIFVTGISIGYVIIFTSIPESKIETSLTVLGQISALVFAVVGGYYAFSQTTESRLDKFKQLGLNYFQKNQLRRAAQYYESAHKISPRDFLILAELLEIYLAQKEFIKFDNKIRYLPDLKVEDRDLLISKYLTAARFLMEERLRDAKDEITKVINFSQLNPQALAQFSWSDKELKGSDAYKQLEGDPKLILDNLLSYLRSQLDVERRLKFENSNYTLI